MHFLLFKVALVRADFASPLPLIISRLATSLQDLETVPVCDDTLVEMEQFVTSVSGIPARDVNLTNALLEGVGLFSNDSNTGAVYLEICVCRIVLFVGSSAARISKIFKFHE